MPFSSRSRISPWAVIPAAFLVVALFPASLPRAQTNSEPGVKTYIAKVGQELDDAMQIAGGLKTRANWAVAITVLAALLSLTSGLLPQVKKKWAKSAALMVGFLAGTTTIVNNNLYGVDSALLEANAYDLEKEVAVMKSRLDTFGSLNPRGPDYEGDLLTWYTDTVRDMGKFRDRREELRRPVRRRPPPAPATTGNSSSGLFVTVSAQVRPTQRAVPPSWVQKAPPEDDRFVYFVGRGVDPDSLTGAKDLSTRDAFRQAESYLGARANACPVAALRDRAAKEGEVIGTYFSSGTVESSNMRAYTYSTLLRLSRALADPSMLKLLVARTGGQTLKIPQLHVAAPRELGGNVAVYVGPGSGGTLRVLVFDTPNAAGRWPSQRTVSYEDVKRTLSAPQILRDVSLGKCGETTFRARDSQYTLTIIEIGSSGDRTATIAIAPERVASARN